MTEPQLAIDNEPFDGRVLLSLTDKQKLLIVGKNAERWLSPQFADNGFNRQTISTREFWAESLTADNDAVLLLLAENECGLKGRFNRNGRSLQEVIAKITDLLKPNGLLYMGVNNKRFYRRSVSRLAEFISRKTIKHCEHCVDEDDYHAAPAYSRSKVKRLLEKSGFRCIDVQYLSPQMLSPKFITPSNAGQLKFMQRQFLAGHHGRLMNAVSTAAIALGQADILFESILFTAMRR